jgi:ATP-dependent DNA helicase RecG
VIPWTYIKANQLSVGLKEVYISDLKKEIVAFANTNGGTIYI